MEPLGKTKGLFSRKIVKWLQEKNETGILEALHKEFGELSFPAFGIIPTKLMVVSSGFHASNCMVGKIKRLILNGAGIIFGKLSARAQ